MPVLCWYAVGTGIGAEVRVNQRFFCTILTTCRILWIPGGIGAGAAAIELDDATVVVLA